MTARRDPARNLRDVPDWYLIAVLRDISFAVRGHDDAAVLAVWRAYMTAAPRERAAS